jgi:hypothetical protein
MLGSKNISLIAEEMMMMRVWSLAAYLLMLRRVLVRV